MPANARTADRDARARLRAAMTFEPERARQYAARGWWREETLSGWLAERAAEAPDRDAIVAPEGRMSYQELAARVERFAGALTELGIARGDVVCVQLPNNTEFVLTLLAAARVGAVASTVHMPYREAEMETLLGHARARAVVCLAERSGHPAAAAYARLRERLPVLAHVIAVGDAPAGTLAFADLVANGRPGPVGDPPRGGDPYLLVYTSGTSAAPKGVPLSHQNMLSNARLNAPDYALTGDDVFLSAAPFTHLFGLYCLHLSLHVGGTNVLLPTFAPPLLASTIESARPSILIAVPAHLNACLGAGLFDAHDVSSLRIVVVSGSASGPALVHAMSAKMPAGRYVHLWGMSELQCGAFTRADDPIEVAARSAGRACPGNELRVVDETGRPVPVGEDGELQVRGCSVFPGYYENDQANSSAFTAEGWFRTGDLARLDEDGNVSITGRQRDLINRGGVKYNPLDVELLIDGHPSVQQSAIVPIPDPVLGERACCFVVPAPGETPTLEALCAYLTEHNIARHKLPERLEIIDEMPLTPTRKVIKGRLVPR